LNNKREQLFKNKEHMEKLPLSDCDKKRQGELIQDVLNTFQTKGTAVKQLLHSSDSTYHFVYGNGNNEHTLNIHTSLNQICMPVKTEDDISNMLQRVVW
jgi:hypothetical protein